MLTMSPARTRTPIAAAHTLLADPTLGAGNFLQRALAVNPAPNEPFLVAQHPSPGGNSAYSINDLVDLTRRGASWYHRAGVRPADPVGIYLDEGIGSFLQYLMLTSLGAIPVLVNGRMPADIAADYLRFVGVIGVVGSPHHLRALTNKAGDPPHLSGFYITATEVEQATTAELPASYPYEHDANDLVMLCHSSGTTGRPKAVMFGHRQFFLGKEHRLVTFAPSPEDRLLTALPQSHSAGISYLMTAVLLGLPTIVMADLRAPAIEHAMTEFRPSMVAAFPHVYAELATTGLKPDAAQHIHTWFNTGDSAHEAHVHQLIQLGHRPEENLPGSRFVDGLGASELGMALFQRVSTPQTTTYDRCVGKPVDVVEDAAALDDDGRALPTGAVGALGVKSPTLTPGYWNDTLRTIKSRRRGYWLTGDQVYRDEEGRFFHLDRTQDVITTSNGTIYSLPLEERLLLSCPDISDCAVIGVPVAPDSDEQVPVAIVVPRPGSNADAVQLHITANKALTAAGLPSLAATHIATPEELPVGPTGKALKRQLRDHLAAGDISLLSSGFLQFTTSRNN